MLEEVVVLMKAYASAEADAYLIPKTWMGQTYCKHQQQADQGPCWGGEQQGQSEQGPRHGGEHLGSCRGRAVIMSSESGNDSVRGQMMGQDAKEGFLLSMP